MSDPTAPTDSSTTTTAALEDAAGSSHPPHRAISIWPPALVSLIALVVFITLHLVGEPTLARLIAVFVSPLLAALFILFWWLAFSRAHRTDKWRGLVGTLLLGVALALLAHPVGRLFITAWGISFTVMIMVFYWALSRGSAARSRRRGLIATALLAAIPWLCIKTAGQNGEGLLTFDWRWSDRAAQALASWRELGVKPKAAAFDLPELSARDWPGFRGPQRDGVYRGPLTPTANNIEAMKERWRHAVGIGWSSFCVVGPVAYTQEQRGDQECVVCYDLDTGAERWVYARNNRFEEVSGGPGPRATPTYLDKRLYTYGPEGHLACLDAVTGTPLWTVEASPKGVPIWGAASSPLLVDDLVIVALYGKNGRLAAYHQADGKLAWRANGGADAYSSPHLVTLAGTRQIVILDGAGFSGHAIGDGKQLWFYPWPTDQPKVVQPWQISDDEILISMGYSEGMRRLRIQQTEDGWTVEEVWISNRLKTKFNDFVCKDGYAYGLDEGILTCIDLTDGSRQWKNGKYGYGQVLLVKDKLLILGEDGDLVLVEAMSSEFKELAVRKIFDEKTWNHPVLARGKLILRNDREAVCFDLAEE